MLYPFNKVTALPKIGKNVLFKGGISNWNNTISIRVTFTKARKNASVALLVSESMKG